MLLLFAFPVSAQPFTQGFYYGPNAPGTPGYAAINRPSEDFQFQLQQANAQIQADLRYQQGSSIFYDTSQEIFFPQATDLNPALRHFSATAKAAAQQITENSFQDQIDYFRATHSQPYTQDEREELNDLVLQRDSARYQKLRRVFRAYPRQQLPYQTFFEREAYESDATLAQNLLSDARDDYRQNPNQANILNVRNAQDALDQTYYNRQASNWDLAIQFQLPLLRNDPSLSYLGSVFRKKASESQLQIGYRNLRAARDAYAMNPSEGNRLQVKLAHLFVRASEQIDTGNTGSLLGVQAFLLGQATHKDQLRASFLVSNRRYQDASDLWLQYDRLKRRILLRSQQATTQQAQAAAGTNEVAQRLLSLSSYGGRAANPALDVFVDS